MDSDVTRDDTGGQLASQMSSIPLDELDSKVSVYDNVHYNYMKI